MWHMAKADLTAEASARQLTPSGSWDVSGACDEKSSMGLTLMDSVLRVHLPCEFSASRLHCSLPPADSGRTTRLTGLEAVSQYHAEDEQHADERVGTWSNGDDVGYSLHGESIGDHEGQTSADRPADFTNGWPVGFFSEIFSYGRQCSVGFENKDCPALAPHVVDNQRCQYTGVKVNEVSRP